MTVTQETKRLTLSSTIVAIEEAIAVDFYAGAML